MNKFICIQLIVILGSVALLSTELPAINKDSLNYTKNESFIECAGISIKEKGMDFISNFFLLFGPNLPVNDFSIPAPGHNSPPRIIIGPRGKP